MHILFFLLVGWLIVVAVGCCCFVFALAISIFTWNQSHRALGTQRQQLEQRTIASAPLGYRWNLTAVGCLRFRHLLRVFKAVGFPKFLFKQYGIYNALFQKQKDYNSNMKAPWKIPCISLLSQIPCGHGHAWNVRCCVAWMAWRNSDWFLPVWNVGEVFLSQPAVV